VVVHRPGQITGHSLTGAANLDDLFYRVIRGCVQLSAYPRVQRTVQFVPVDYVAEAIAHFSLDPGSWGRAYHWINPVPMPIESLFGILVSQGYPMQALPYPEWYRRLRGSIDDNGDNALLPLLALFSPIEEETFAPLAPQRCALTLDALKGTSILCPPCDEAILSVYLRYLEASDCMPRKGN
jgi:thioester reductase-like protein